MTEGVNTMRMLEGKWALVTGSSRGIGRQIAKGLAERKCNLVVHGRKAANTDETVEILSGSGVQVRRVSGDLSKGGGIQAVIDGVRAGPGHVDILYNNAGVMSTWKPIRDVAADEWLDIFRVNLLAMIALCNAFTPEMQRRGYGRIINLTSGIKDTPSLAPYGVSKAAVEKYTADLAAELKDSNVLVNCLDPGWLRTDMGGPDATYPVEDVLPGALVPALLEDNGPSGQRFAAQDYRMLA
jgi:NAD(P)-dependent dehydrogenase (short-subunit alcohol dehydrogenase family)